MKNKLIWLIIPVILIMGCSKDDDIKPSGNITTVEHNIKGYNQLRIEDAFDVKVDISNEDQKIIVEANENLHNRIVVKKELNELIIKLEDNTNLEGDFTLKVFITADYLNEFTITGASSVAVNDTLGGSSFKINITGASSFEGILMGGDINLTLTGASAATLSGTADKLNADAIGASVLEAFGMQANWLHSVLEGASVVSVTVDSKLDVWASGASIVYYKGDGIINTQELSGSSKIIKVE